jgi:hypothetical protein
MSGLRKRDRMIKVTYSLMAKGKANGIRIFMNKQVIKAEEPIDAVYYGQPQYVIGSDEEACYAKIRPKLKNRYEGFRVLQIENLKKEVIT